MKIVIAGASPFEFDKKSMEFETATWSEFLNGERTTAEQMLWSEEINPKEQDFDSDRDLEKVKESLWWMLDSQETNTLADGLIGRISSMLDERASRITHKDKDNDW